MESDRILDAAAVLFAERGVAPVGMKDIARAAGCSRATLYRYFDNREALLTSYVHREARTAGRRIATLIADVDPGDRLLAGLLAALRLVRENPSLSAWFTDSALGARAAGESDVVQALASSFLQSLDIPDAAPRARWLVRVLTSLLVSPGRDTADERAMLEEFVVPTLVPGPVRNAPG